MRPRQAAALGALAILAACSREAPAPGALSAEDERRLDAAAEMLDANAVDVNAMMTNEADADD